MNKNILKNIIDFKIERTKENNQKSYYYFSKEKEEYIEKNKNIGRILKKEF